MRIIYALPLERVLSLKALPDHETLLGDGLELWTTPEDGLLCFVSHQWTALGSPDPSGIQLSVLQHTLSNLLDVLPHLTEFPDRPANDKEQMDHDPLLERVRAGARVYVWLDYWSVPQHDSENQRNAILSIPHYTAAASFMFVLAPTVTHGSTGAVCDYSTWEERGWCRLERLGFVMTNYTVVHTPVTAAGLEPRISPRTNEVPEQACAPVCSSHVFAVPSAVHLHRARTWTVRAHEELVDHLEGPIRLQRQVHGGERS